MNLNFLKPGISQKAMEKRIYRKGRRKTGRLIRKDMERREGIRDDLPKDENEEKDEVKNKKVDEGQRRSKSNKKIRDFDPKNPPNIFQLIANDVKDAYEEAFEKEMEKIKAKKKKRSD